LANYGHTFIFDLGYYSGVTQTLWRTK